MMLCHNKQLLSVLGFSWLPSLLILLHMILSNVAFSVLICIRGNLCSLLMWAFWIVLATSLFEFIHYLNTYLLSICFDQIDQSVLFSPDWVTQPCVISRSGLLCFSRTVSGLLNFICPQKWHVVLSPPDCTCLPKLHPYIQSSAEMYYWTVFNTFTGVCIGSWVWWTVELQCNLLYTNACQ